MVMQIGWASCDLTPDRPVFVSGQFHSRISEGVMDPITATVLVLDSETADSGAVFLVSCDVVAIPDGLRDLVRKHAKELLPEINPKNIIINATHTHEAPEIRVDSESPFAAEGTKDEDDFADNGISPIPGLHELEKGMTLPAEYTMWASRRIAAAIAEAWKKRAPGGIGYGLGQAVVGHNRRVSYFGGASRMYGETSDPDFSHIEGYEDHSVNILCTWDKDKNLTGMIINVACPSQDNEGFYVLSADYWHDVREEIRKRFGDDVYVLAQPSASGDQSPHLLLNREAEQRMWRLMECSHRQDLAVRIADSVSRILPYIEKEIDWNPVLNHTVENVDLQRRFLSEWDVSNAAEDADRLRSEYNEIVKAYEKDPDSRTPKEWYTDLTNRFRMMRWNEAVAMRYALEKKEPTIPAELHALRLGDIAIATNPFEYYLDFGMQIKAHSQAIQTFVVQLAGGGTYLPTHRAIQGKSYGAMAPSTPVGPEGGKQVVDWTVNAINSFFAPPDQA